MGDKYKSNNRVNLTYLKRIDRKKIRPTLRESKLTDFSQCPHCKSTEGVYIEQLREILITKKISFNQDIPEDINVITNEIWKSQSYLCVDCEKPVSLVEK